AAPAPPFDAGARGQRNDRCAGPVPMVPRHRCRGTPRARRAAPRLQPALRYDRDPVGCSPAARRAAVDRMGREMAAAKGTYVYALVSADTPPRLTRVPAGLPGTGTVRLLDAGPNLYVVAADAPLDRYGEAAINRGLGDLDWVSRA